MILPVVFIAALIYLLNQVAPEYATTLMTRLIPLFVVVTCIQGALMHAKLVHRGDAMMRMLEEMQQKLGSALAELRAHPMPTVRVFTNAADFHAYIEERFATAVEVRVTHFSAGSSELLDDAYQRSMDSFIRRGGIYRRVIADTFSEEVWQAQKLMLDTYADSRQQFKLHFVPFISVNDIKILDMMLIDDTELCLGGGYTQGLVIPVISIREPTVVKFFSNYYSYLKDKSQAVRVDRFPDRTFVDEMLTRAKESASAGMQWGSRVRLNVVRPPSPMKASNVVTTGDGGVEQHREDSP
ncbi:MAG TPA: hypothetical protein VE974_20325 [Thermoanaerobaculia bacterium]|nr:hypothetical protein [Thermoanaerobaculia bacterium]